MFPPLLGPWRRFLRGLTLPLALRRAALGDADARGLYRRVVSRQAAITIVAGVGAAAGLFFLALWLARQDGTSVTWSEAGLAVHSGRAPTGNEGVPLDDPWKLLAGFGYVLFGTLTLAEGIVVALSREFHDQIGRRVAILTGVAPEDPEATPRVRLNLRWLWTKMKRKMRGGRVFIAGLPVLGIVALVPFVGAYAYGAVTFIWSFYWLAVFAGAKSARAWNDEHTAPEPFFLRVAGKVPVVRWYARLWRRLTRAVFAPCRRVEEHPYELAGLAVARLIGTLPVLYLFFRPFLPVAAATVISRPDRG